jgi:hypothetical protein
MRGARSSIRVKASSARAVPRPMKEERMKYLLLI